MESTQEASQPDAIDPLPNSSKGTSVHDLRPLSQKKSDDEDERPKKTQKKPIKKALEWGKMKAWQKIPKEDRDKIQEY
ncbi:hypothetical protein L3X38_041502 [Prunus dulcis]|uniref:Uncharacterized protein n=1 Tax=Prunus dulcis TaxID=3755 RepID=A0AAD4UT62_PRUDU|nr:hypothetical protein L3X38_041502 [Prunus dulcis]